MNPKAVCNCFHYFITSELWIQDTSSSRLISGNSFGNSIDINSDGLNGILYKVDFVDNVGKVKMELSISLHVMLLVREICMGSLVLLISSIHAMLLVIL